MANMRYFADVDGEAHELKNVGHRGDGFYGIADAFPLKYVQGEGWTGYLKATRKIEMKANPSKHACDARCMFAQGKTMKCECSCGGKNHGRGAFLCEAA